MKLFLLLGAMLLTTPLLAIDFTGLMKDDLSPKKIVYKTVGNEPISLNVFLPSDWKPGEKRPAAVWIHGGAWVAGDAQGFFPQARYFANRGMVGVSLDYRLLGKDATHLRDCISDCKSAIRYLRQHAAELGIDPQRIAVLGDSAGGHLAACLALVDGCDDPQDDLTFSPAPNAMVLCNGVLDLTGPKWIHYAIGGEAVKKNSPESLAAPTAEDEANAQKVSPLYLVKAGLPPTLVMQGLEDKIVEPQQATHFTDKMKAAGNRCDLVLIEHARHAFICVKYTASEADVVEQMKTIDRYLASLGYITGAPTLELSPTPAWEAKGKPKAPTKP